MIRHKSPFKFLDPFTLADRANFFGREKEVESLYRMVLKTPLLLLYGLSGTGKTSMVQCGLASKFDGPDWLPLWIRRRDNLLQSTHYALDESLKSVRDTNLPVNVAGKIDALYRHFLRPVFLLFDQFEELFILGDQEEQYDFVAELKAIVETGLPCTVLLIVREEYLGQLYPLEKEIPSLFDFRMRVEPMSNASIKTVLRESFIRFNITVEPPAAERYEQMIANVNRGRSGIELPYLQVYLDRLYRYDYKRTYPQGDALPAHQWPAIEFTGQEIQDFGTISEVLDNFLREQRDRLQLDLKEWLPAENFPETTVALLLDAFVSEEGTRRPIGIRRDAGMIHVIDRQQALFPPLSPEAFTFCVERFEQARLLHSTETSLELAHDTLASVIEKYRSGEQQQLAEVRRRLRDGYSWYMDAGRTRFFDRVQLAYIEPFLKKITLEPEWLDFLEASRQNILAEENAESIRNAKELQLAEDNLAIEQKARKRQLRYTRAIAVVAVLALLASLIAFLQYRKAELQRKAALDSEKIALEQKALADTLRYVSDQALRTAQQSDSIARAERDKVIKTLKELNSTQAAKDKLRFNILKAAVADYKKAGYCDQARKNLVEALRIARLHPELQSEAAALKQEVDTCK